LARQGFSSQCTNFSRNFFCASQVEVKNRDIGTITRKSKHNSTPNARRTTGHYSILST
jgi:hypothetical protein